MGVNLPAHLVVIKSTQAWRGAGHGYTEYQTSTLLQMMGRAGRPQFDTSGTAVIMTASSTAPRYRALATGSEAVESCLQSSIIEHLASEICLGTVTSLTGALRWLQSTFLSIRMAANPRQYRLPPGATPLQVAAQLRQLTCNCIYALAQAQCIKLTRGSAAATSATAKKPQHQKSSTTASAGATSMADAWIPSGPKDLFDTWQKHSRSAAPASTSAAAGASSSFSSAAAADAGWDEGEWIKVSPLGPAFVMTRHYISFDTLAMFRNIPRDSEVQTAIGFLCRAKEIITGLTLRREEKKVSNESYTWQGLLRRNEMISCCRNKT